MIVVRDLAVTYSAIQVERSAKSNNVPLRDLALGNSARITVRAWKLSISPFRSLKTYDINEAADFLKVDRSTALDLAGNGTLPGAKVGRAWVFLEQDLADYVRSLYSQPRQALQVTLRKEMECHFANAAGSGGSTSSLQMGSEYAVLLGLPIKP